VADLRRRIGELVDSLEHSFEFFYLKRAHCRCGSTGAGTSRCANRRSAEIGAGNTQVAMPGDDAGDRHADEVVARCDGRVLALAVRWPLILPCLLFHPEDMRQRLNLRWADGCRASAWRWATTSTTWR
jgi:hypothetical protein